MASYIFEFVHREHCIAMYRDDHDMYRVIHIRTAASEGGERSEVLVGTLSDKEMATHVFNRECQRLQRDWELELQ